MTDHIKALHEIFLDCHDVVDVGGGDRPSQGPNWAMRCTALLDEIEDLIPCSERVALFKSATNPTEPKEKTGEM